MNNWETPAKITIFVRTKISHFYVRVFLSYKNESNISSVGDDEILFE